MLTSLAALMAAAAAPTQCPCDDKQFYGDIGYAFVTFDTEDDLGFDTESDSLISHVGWDATKYLGAEAKIGIVSFPREGSNDIISAEVKTTVTLGAYGVAGIVAAMRYTIGKQAYGYQGFGDVYVMLFFGLVGVLGVGLLVAHEVPATWVLPAVFSGCMSVAVLNLNNLRDHQSDAVAGKRTMVVRLGFEGGKRYHLALLGVGWGALLLFFQGPWEVGMWRGTMWYALLALLHARHAVDVWRCDDPSTLDPELKRIALSTFLVVLFMFMDQTLGA